jgi:hypothetical protein
VTIYARRRGQAVVASLLFGLLAVVAHANGAESLAVGTAVTCGIALAYFSRRPRLTANDRGITVVNLILTRRIPWRDVEGFAFEWAGFLSCLAIHRRDGRVVHAWVVTDDARNGYSSWQIEGIVHELRARQDGAGGAGERGDVAGLWDLPAERPRSRRVVESLPTVTAVLVCGFLAVFGAAAAWNAIHRQPAVYAQLKAYGVPVWASFAGCSIAGIKDEHCRLSLAYEGRSRTWTYREDYTQFRGLAVGAPVSVLVDPAHPTTVYTARDVASGYGTGLGVMFFFGVGLALAGLLGLVWFVRFERRVAALQRGDLSALGSPGLPSSLRRR